MATPDQVKRRFHMKVVARGIIYGLPAKVIAEKLGRKTSWVNSVIRHRMFESILEEVEGDILKTSEREISAIRAKSLRVLSKLLESKNEKIRLEAFDRAKQLHDFKEGIGPGGLGHAGQESEEEDEDDYLLSEGHVKSAMIFLEQTSKDKDFIDVTPVKVKKENE